FKDGFGFSGLPIHDVCTVAYLIAPSIFQLEHVHVDAETKGELSYGMTVVDTIRTTGKEPHVHFVVQLDFDKLWDLMTRASESYQQEDVQANKEGNELTIL